MEANVGVGLRQEIAVMQEQYTTKKTKMTEEQYRQSMLALLLKLEACSQLTGEELQMKEKIQMHGTVQTTGSGEVSSQNAQAI